MEGRSNGCPDTRRKLWVEYHRRVQQNQKLHGSVAPVEADAPGYLDDGLDHYDAKDFELLAAFTGGGTNAAARANGRDLDEFESSEAPETKKSDQREMA